MAAISKIRVVNLHYAKQQNYYRDLTFHFLTDNGIPSNGAITFPNGNGKGALIQAINQVFLPETHWGSKNENTPLHYFMKDNKFAPYTFYIIIEWWISFTRRLMTGIAMTAEEITDPKPEYKIKYRLFGKRYQKNEYDIGKLPVWDHETKTVKKFSVFESDLREEKGVFHYAPSGKANFFKECRTYGVYESDWAELKKINRLEAGIGPYFEQKNATRNETFFRNMLIPSIVERNEIVNSIDIQSQLSQQFKDSATIANNLPNLLAREKTHHEILELVSRFDTPLANYDFAESQIKEHKRTGENIIANMDAMIHDSEEKLEGIQTSIEGWTTKEEENQWKKSNWKFVRAARELVEQKKDLESTLEEQGDASSTKRQAEERFQDAERKLLVKKYRTEEKNYQDIQHQIQRLEQSAEMKEITTKEQEIRKNIEAKWSPLKGEIIRVQKGYQQYVEQAKHQSDQINDARHQLMTDIGGLKVVLSGLKDRISAYESKVERAKQKYGYSVQVKPEETQTKLQEEITSCKNVIAEAERFESVWNRKMGDLMKFLGTLKSDISNTEKLQKTLKNKLSVQREKETQWINQTARLLKLSPDECQPSFAWLQSMIPDLRDLQEKRVKTEKDLQVQLLKLEQQIQLSDEDHLIFNVDIQRIGELLTRYNIYHQTGSEFLMELDEETRRQYNERFPHLKYSIIVQTPHLDELKLKINFSQELLQSPVYIIDAKNIEGFSDSSFLFQNQADEFVEQPDKWKEYLQTSLQQKARLEEEIRNVGAEAEEISQLWNLLNHFPQEDSSDFLSQEISQLQTELDKHKQKQEANQIKLQDINRQIEENREKEKASRQKLREQEENLKELEQFIESTRQYQQDVQDRSKLTTEKSEKEAKQLVLLNQSKEIEEETAEWQSLYSDWKANAQQIMKRIQNVLSEAEFPNESGSTAIEGIIDNPSLPENLFDDILGDVALHEELTHTLEQKSSKIAELKGMNRVYLGNVQKAKEELLAFDSDALSASEPSEPVDYLKLQKDKWTERLKTAEKTFQEAEKRVEAATAVVKSMQKQVDDLIEEIRQHHGRNVDDSADTDLDVLAKEIEEEFSRIRQALGELEEEEKKVLQAKSAIEKTRPTVAVQIGYHNEVPLEIKENIMDQLIESMGALVDEWSNEYEKRKRRRTEAFNALGRIRKNSIEDIKESSWDEKIKQNILEQYNVMDISHLSTTKDTLEGIRAVSQYELEVLKEDKEKGIEARDRWVRYAAQFSSNIVKAIFEMIESMEVKNRGGYTFPLVKIKNKRRLSTKADEYHGALERYFDQAIQKANGTGIPIESFTLREIHQIINIADIVYNALGNQYPQFDIYNLDKENVFMYDAPRSEYYVDWEVLNEGSLTQSAGSGGQKVSGRTIMFLMMMSHKRRVSEKDWQFFYMDNPFANAISASVVDPIFAITEALNYQLIVVAPPELMKAEISMKFPSLHDLSFEKEQTGKSRVCVNRRQYLNPSAFMTEAFEEEVMGFSTVKNADFEQGEFILD